MLMMSARLFSTMYSTELVMPSTMKVGVPITNLMCGIGSDAAGNLNVEIGFAVVTRLDAVVLAGVDEDGIVDGKIEQLAIGLNVAHQNVGTADDGDAHSAAVDPCLQQRSWCCRWWQSQPAQRNEQCCSMV